jgi:N-acyl-D-aspartate/D-glutamate deacylase
MADLLVRGGTVVDGTGSPARSADVRVRDGRIVEVGPGLRPDGEAEVDAGGAVVAPGFVDIHTHYDPSLWWDPTASPIAAHGYTTVVIGNCSLSLAPVRPEHREQVADMFCFIEDLPLEAFRAAVPWTWESWSSYQDAVSGQGAAVNVAGLVGHSALRLYVMGEDAFERAADDTERAALAAALDECLAVGAFGLSTSFVDQDRAGRPVPSRRADDAEFAALGAALGRRGGVLQFVPRFPVDKLWERDVERMATAIRGWPAACATYAPLTATPTSTERNERLMDQVLRLRAEGVTMWPQVTPRPLDVNISLERTPLFAGIAAWHGLIAAAADDKRAMLRDPAWRQRAREDWDTCRYTLFPWQAPWRVLLAGVAAARPDLASWRGRTLEEWRAARPGGDGQGHGGAHASDALADWLVENDLDVSLVTAASNDDPALVGPLLADPTVLVGASDAGAHLQMMCGAGDSTILLARFVREHGHLTLEAAVRALTAVPAAVFGLPARGRIVEGAMADLTVFELDALEWRPPEMVFDVPPAGEARMTRPSSGYRATVVAGTLTAVEGSSTGAVPGRMLART